MRGSGGSPPARGFRNHENTSGSTETRKNAGQRAATRRPPPGQPRRLPRRAMIAPFGAGAGRGPAGPPESCLRTCREDGFAPLRGSDGGCPGGYDRALGAGARRAESRVVGIAMTYSQGIVSGGVNNRRNGDVQRVPEPSQRETGPPPAAPPPPPPNWCLMSWAGGPAPRSVSRAPWPEFVKGHPNRSGCPSTRNAPYGMASPMTPDRPAPTETRQRLRLAELPSQG